MSFFERVELEQSLELEKWALGLEKNLDLVSGFIKVSQDKG